MIKKIEKYTFKKSGRLVVGKTRHIYWQTSDGSLFNRKKKAIEYESKGRVNEEIK